MKRCPHCEFIYNDDQFACDMDGNALVFDTSTTLPAVISQTKTRRAPSMFVVAISGFVLALVAWLCFLFTPGPVSQAHGRFDLKQAVEVPPLASPLRAPSPVQMPATPPQFVPSTSDAGKDFYPGNVQKTDPRLTIPRGLAPLPRLQPIPRLASAKPSPRVVEIERDEKDSKVKSFLKKTGRVLKKPFKF